jgi:DNA-binding NarL/FixJ family response regulator
MIVCAIDDLLFSIKIKDAAKHLGVELYFERSADRIVDTVRDKQPSLVVFDLNSARMAPMDAITAIKADPALASVRTLGYVSHVDAATIAAARQAGVDEVLARSAFAARLGEILTTA